jgi:hypothetical protein
MSLLLQLGARIRSTSDELPVAGVAAAADRLRVAIDLLTWVRQASMRPLGVPQLSGALEHTEHAARALLVAREELAAYLVGLGLAAEAVAPDPLGQSAPVAAASGRSGAEPAVKRPERGGVAAHPAGSTTGAPKAPDLPPLRRWWCERVDALTGRTGDYGEKGAAVDSTELLRRIAAAGDPDRIRAELVRSGAPIGLGLAALAPAALRNLAAELFGRPPGPDDLPELVKAVDPRVRELLPHTDPETVTELLGRVCRVPVPARREESQKPPAHPADAAITGAVLVSVLLDGLGHKPEQLDRYLILPEPPTDDRDDPDDRREPTDA